jgi:hypothetical protein
VFHILSYREIFLFDPYFAFAFVLTILALQWLPDFTHIGRGTLQTCGFYQLFLILQTCLETIWPTPLLPQQQLRLNFVFTMRRNHTFGSASSRPSSQRQESNHKNSNMPMPIANLPKQVLRDILDTLDVDNASDDPVDCLKDAWLGQFGQSNWQSYFELLRLPMKMQGLKPSVFIGKLKQNLPPGVSPDTDLFLAMFLICLPPSMLEAVGAGNHKTAAAMVKAADAL